MPPVWPLQTRLSVKPGPKVHAWARCRTSVSSFVSVYLPFTNMWYISDCAYKNILMDGRSLYTERFHPVLQNHDWTIKRRLRPLPRCEASVRYYFIDYGISDYFAPGEERELVVGEDGHDQDVPELSEDHPYDPFMVDIFIIGNLLRTLLHKVFFPPSTVMGTCSQERISGICERGVSLWSH